MSRIALLVPELLAGGAQRVMLLLSRELVGRGHRVDLLLIQERGALLGAIPNGVRTVQLTSGKFSLHALVYVPVALIRLIFWLRREQPDVLLSTITGTNLLAVLARALSLSGVRLVLREAVSLKNVINPLRLLVMRSLYPHADAIITLSRAMTTELQNQFGLGADRLYCIPNPVDVEAIRRCALEEFHHPWLNATSTATLVTVGRLIPQKDQATLIRAVALLPEILSARLIIVGDGPEHRALEKLACELDVADRVFFAGFDANPWRWMVRAHLFVLSSHWEGCPNVLLEAQALGLPIVSTEYDASVYSVLDTRPDSLHRVVAIARPDLLAMAIADVLTFGNRTLRRHPETVGNSQAIVDYEAVLTGTTSSGKGV